MKNLLVLVTLLSLSTLSFATDEVKWLALNGSEVNTGKIKASRLNCEIVEHLVEGYPDYARTVLDLGAELRVSGGYFGYQRLSKASRLIDAQGAPSCALVEEAAANSDERGLVEISYRVYASLTETFQGLTLSETFVVTFANGLEYKTNNRELIKSRR